MIAMLHGVLVGLERDRALVSVQGVGLTYEVLVPSFTVGRLGGSIDHPVTLHTLHFLESQNQGSSFLPRLAGFLTPQDRRFYELLISCKGIGHRKGLRAMSLASHQIAGAIADRDVKTLQTLPEIGKRMAETLIVALRDKVEPFLSPDPGARRTAGGDGAMTAASSGETSGGTSGGGGIVRDALEALTQLGENRVEALELIERVMTSDDPPTTADQLVAAVYAMKR